MSTKTKSKTALDSPVFGLRNKLARVIWAITYTLLFRFSPTPLFAFRAFLLSCFGAKIGRNVRIYPSVKIWLPVNLSIHAGASIGPRADIYNQGKISIGENTIVSQGAYICASTHDYNDPVHPIVLAPITIGSNVWLCAECFVGPGVKVANGTVVGARAVLTKDTEQWSVYGGNPAQRIRDRSQFQDS